MIMLIVYSEKFSIEKISLYVYWFKETDLYTVETICIQKICKLLLLLAKPISHLINFIMQIFIASPLMCVRVNYFHINMKKRSHYTLHHITLLHCHTLLKKCLRVFYFIFQTQNLKVLRWLVASRFFNPNSFGKNLQFFFLNDLYIISNSWKYLIEIFF